MKYLQPIASVMLGGFMFYLGRDDSGAAKVLTFAAAAVWFLLAGFELSKAVRSDAND